MDTQRKTFEAIMVFLAEESGDGDVHVDCKYASKNDLSKKFNDFLSEQNEYTTHSNLKYMGPCGEVVLFSDGCNENVTFADTKDKYAPPVWIGIVIQM